MCRRYNCEHVSLEERGRISARGEERRIVAHELGSHIRRRRDPYVWERFPLFNPIIVWLARCVQLWIASEPRVTLLTDAGGFANVNRQIRLRAVGDLLDMSWAVLKNPHLSQSTVHTDSSCWLGSGRRKVQGSRE